MVEEEELAINIGTNSQTSILQDIWMIPLWDTTIASQSRARAHGESGKWGRIWFYNAQKASDRSEGHMSFPTNVIFYNQAVNNILSGAS